MSKRSTTIPATTAAAISHGSGAMAVYGHYKEPQNYYKDKQMNHGVKKEWKEDYQKNKYQKKEKYGEKMTY